MPSDCTPNRLTVPTPADLVAARRNTLPDLIAPGLSILFCGINPGLYSAAVGYHFARPGNRFSSTLDRAGITERLLTPAERRELLQYGCGITDPVSPGHCSSASADEYDVVFESSAAGSRSEAVSPNPRTVSGACSQHHSTPKPSAVLRTT
jgi:double-stranded uracil-DNA glycosylase